VAGATITPFVDAGGIAALDADNMFAAADAVITTLYSDPTGTGRAALDTVGSTYDGKKYLEALYDLQNATTNVYYRQLFRACYASKLSRLFELVNKHFNK
jgi:hypothetical protein